MDRYAALKAAVRDAVDAAGGTVRAARISRADNARISRYGSIHDAMHAPIDVVADIEQEIGDPIITRMLAELAGYALVPLAAANAQGAAFGQHIADVARSMGGVVADMAEAQADGVVDAREAAGLLRKISDAETEMAEAKADLERVVSTARATAPAPLRRVGN